MKIVVCLKAVLGQVTKFNMVETESWVDFHGGPMVMNESDEYALEEALALKKELGAEVIVVTAGQLAAQEVLNLGVAKGADRAVRINTNLRDPESIARVLAGAIKTIGCDLILTGVESYDNMASQVGISVAAILGHPFAFAVTSVEAGQIPGTIRVTKELGSGYTQVLELVLPALLCIQSGVQHLSYVPFRKLLEARRKPVESMTVGDSAMGVNETKGKRCQIIEAFSPKSGRRAKIIGGKPSEVALVLMGKIREAL